VIGIELPEGDYEILKEIADTFMKKIEIRLWILGIMRLDKSTRYVNLIG
jgi:hypothetical protein